MSASEARVRVRRFVADDWRVYRELRLRALADAPDSFGSTFEHETNRPDSEWSHRLAIAVEAESSLPLVAELDGEAIGIAWGRIETDPAIAALYQMWVAPSQRGLGAARMLLDAVVAWARAQRASYLDLAVTCGDTPARRLYERAGFKPIGSPRSLRPGSALQAQRMRLSLSNAT